MMRPAKKNEESIYKLVEAIRPIVEKYERAGCEYWLGIEKEHLENLTKIYRKINGKQIKTD